MHVLHLQKCRSDNPLMETMKENHKAYTVTYQVTNSRSEQVTINQSRKRLKSTMVKKVSTGCLRLDFGIMRHLLPKNSVSEH